MQKLAIANRRTAWVQLALTVLILALAGWWWFRTPGAASRVEKITTVPVATAVRRTVPNYLEAIATVQALNTVVVRARVDGLVEKVAFQEGARVRRDDVLVVLDRLPFEAVLRAARAQQQKDVAQLENIRRDVARYEMLVNKNLLAAQTLDTSRAQLAQQVAVVDADKAQVEQAELQLGYATIRSPIDGRLGARLVDAGNIVHANDANGLVVVSQLRPVTVAFSLPQTALPALRNAQHARVVAQDPTSRQTVASGELSFIDSQVETATGTIRCKATFANDGETLWPGAFVNVRVFLKDIADAVLVPTRALQAGVQQPYVYIVNGQDVVEMRSVVTGAAVDAETVIASGLQGGERVVLEGQYQLENGAHVVAKPAAKPADGAPSPASPATPASPAAAAGASK